jgi:hypothetical protein
MQRLGAAMWSGDIASRLGSLAAHGANQMHMSFSGMDYYGADIGGFHRNLDGDLDEMYTRWFAYGMLFDIPGRPHVENLCNCKETAPDRIGDLASNRYNARLRYTLVPYLYSLAHRAHRFGEAVMPPPVLYYQTDERLRNEGDHKLIGRDLLAAASTRYDQDRLDVYLPDGVWYDWHDNRRYSSAGGSTLAVPTRRAGVFTLPLFARAGAIVPTMEVDEQTANALGKRRDGSERQALAARIYASAEPSEFTLYEDDGATIAYRSGAVRETRISQQQSGDRVTIDIDPAQGDYAGAPIERDNQIALVASLNGQSASATSVQLDGEALPEQTDAAAFAAAERGWRNELTTRTIQLKSGSLPVAQAKAFEVVLAAVACTSEHGSIAMPSADNGWDPADPARQLACVEDKTWSGIVDLCGGAYKFAADGGWTRNWGSDGAQDGPNFPPPTASGRYRVTFDETDAANPELALIDAEAAQCGVSADFVCENGLTTWGDSVYVVGNIPLLGEWRPEAATLLSPDGPYPTWTRSIGGLPPGTQIEWKCIKRQESGDPPLVREWQGGENNRFTTPATGTAGRRVGRF